MNKMQSIVAAAGLVAGLIAGATHAAGAPGPVLAVISHPVKDYAAWRPAYQSAETLRSKAGVTAAEVFRDPADANQLVIIHRFETLAAAQGFLADPALKAVMDKGGVLAPPRTILGLGKPGKTVAGLGPVLVLVTHPVKDYATWLVAYDAAEPIRAKAGVTGAEVFRDPKNPNDVVIIHRFKTVAAAQGFLADPDLKAAMDKGGVTAPPGTLIAVAP